MKSLKDGPQSVLMNRMADYTGKAGAEELAGRIKAYWNALGKFPAVWAEERTFPGTLSAMWVVRSDMIGARPQ